MAVPAKCELFAGSSSEKSGGGHAHGAKRCHTNEGTARPPRFHTAYGSAAANGHVPRFAGYAQIQRDVARELAAYKSKSPVIADILFRRHQEHYAHGSSVSLAMTLFEECIAKGDLDAVRSLVEHGASVEAQVRERDKALPIHLACAYGQLEIVKYLVTRGARVNGVYTADKMSPLSLACRFGHFEIIKWLIENGARVVDRRGRDGGPLAEAVRWGDVLVVRYLISVGAATSAKDPKHSAWSVAVLEGRFRILKYLVEARLSDLTEDEFLQSCVLECATEKENVDVLRYLLPLGVFDQSQMDECLCLATEAQSIEIMKLLVSNGANVNGLCQYGETPLFRAVRCTVADVTETLLSLGADANTSPSAIQYSAIHNMVNCGRLDLLKIVRRVCGKAANFTAPSGREGYTPLHLAAAAGHVDIVRFLLEVLSPDVNIDIETPFNETPLTRAASGGHLDVARLLLSEGATINRHADRSDPAALFCAAGSGRFDVVELLCENGADVQWRGDDGASSLCIAASDGAASIVEYLAEVHGADLNVVTFDLTALNKAVIHGHTEVVRVLLAHNASAVDAQELRSDLLCQAVWHRRVEIVRLLVKNGADVNAKYSFAVGAVELELTPLLVAAVRGDLGLVKYLCDNGADVEGTNNRNETALFFAAAWGELDVVRYLVSEQNANVQSTSSYGFTPAEVSFADHHNDIYEFLLSRGAVPSSRLIAYEVTFGGVPWTENAGDDDARRFYSHRIDALTEFTWAFFAGDYSTLYSVELRNDNVALQSKCVPCDRTAMAQPAHAMASTPPASKKRHRAPPSPTTAAAISAAAASLASAPGGTARGRGGRRRESGTGDEDDGEIDEMLEALGIPDSDKKRKKQQVQQQRQAVAQVIELITPPRVSGARPVRAGATSVVSIDDEDDDTSALLDSTAPAIEGGEGDRRRESIVDLTSPDANAEEGVVRMPSSPVSGLSAQARGASMVATGTIAPQRVRRTILISTLESEVQGSTPLQPASPVVMSAVERTRPRQASPPKTPSSDRECDAMLEDLLLSRPLAERISAARGRDSSSSNTRIAADKERACAEQVSSRVERFEPTIAQGGGFLYSSFSSTTVRASAGPRNSGTTATLTTVSETLDFRLSSSRLEDAFPSRPTAETIAGAIGETRQQTASDTPQKKARAAPSAPKASKSKQEPVVAVVRMERTLHDSEAGQVLKRALQTHVYNNKPLVFELGSPFDCMHTNVIQWERRERIFAARSKGVGGPSSSAVASASSICRFLSTAIYFQAEDFIQLLHQQSYTEVLSIMQFLKKDLQARATREQRRQGSFQADAESDAIQLSTFLIIEGMDKCLINLKKNRKTSQAPQFSFSDIHEMAFQLFMDTETHTKFTVDLDSTASYVAMVTREIVIAAAKKTAQEDFLESVPRLHSFRVTSTGATMNNFANSWLRMLQMIPGVSEDKAQSILDHFPTFSSLMLAYSDPNVSQEVKEDLLATKLSGKNVGRAISKRIFNVFCVDDPDALI